MSSTRISRHINAPRATVYRALLDPTMIVRWKVPDGMTAQVHEFDAREGGRIRISLIYDEPTGLGKSSARIDTYHGRFVKLRINEQVVEVDEFETRDPALQGEMTITITLSDAGGGTDIFAFFNARVVGSYRRKRPASCASLSSPSASALARIRDTCCLSRGSPQ